jgi:3-deoxy-D-manno-octulosonic-acid transferase
VNKIRSKPTWRFKMYRGLQTGVVQKWLLPRVLPSSKLTEMNSWLQDNTIKNKAHFRPKNGFSRIWFHASSVGELESLWSVIANWSKRPGESIITIFSDSARQHVKLLSGEFSSERQGELLFTGYSPWEGNWSECLRRAAPDVFVTAKYEAWPELWASLAELDIPLVIVGAKDRRSLRLGRRICTLLGSRLPQMVFMVGSHDDKSSLQALFPNAQIHIADDPRWDRVRERSERGNPRAKDLVRKFAGLPKPWGILGSIWPEDLEIWRDLLKTTHSTLWLVPHRADLRHLEQIEQELRRCGVPWLRTSCFFETEKQDSLECPAGACILVDEVGFLSELYSSADWAFVGGGFGAGVHSTIEPAIHGIPIAAGPRGSEKFPEIQVLKSSQQLTLVHDQVALEKWLKSLSFITQTHQKQWRDQVSARFGASERVLSLLPLPC